ncbi:hypothetical protein [Fructilactobacillus sanfranciscensis]|uniref:Uncharacterized protein n=1 Tax=Fructilactobacillus sanfranciscensis TaxID=1625 RepID=A0A5C4THF7_FRUSA|nr:hypothetical protein [Fructilactobacillus sanfranciscensis]TNK89855.1 hypothetical protein DID87_06540 [Fructilactobacillus sanfranciscensis]TNL01586.1 hypothetical protein DOL84_02330 [Fructilactobacillus sanfranciscensis]
MRKSVRLITLTLIAMTLGGIAVPSMSAFADAEGISSVTKIDYQSMNSDQLGNLIDTYDMDNLTTNQENVVSIYSAKLQDELKAEVSQSAPAPETITTPRFQSRAALGLMARLVAKYGKVYVSKTLPKILYKKVAKLIGKKVSQAKFLHIWNNTIGVATGAALESAIAKGLKACGVPKGIANKAATIIATAVGILV